jgi:hypothetical protein
MAASSAAPDFQSLFRALPDNYLLLAPDGTVVDNTDAHVAVSLLPRERLWHSQRHPVCTMWQNTVL